MNDLFRQVMMTPGGRAAANYGSGWERTFGGAQLSERDAKALNAFARDVVHARRSVQLASIYFPADDLGNPVADE